MLENLLNIISWCFNFVIVVIEMWKFHSIEIARKIADILDVSLDYLTGKTDVEMYKKTQKRILKVSKFSDEDRNHIFSVIDAFIAKSKNTIYIIKQNPQSIKLLGLIIIKCFLIRRMVILNNFKSVFRYK